MNGRSQTGQSTAADHVIQRRSAAAGRDRSNLKAFAVNTLNMLTRHVKLDNPS